ncbi:MAG: M24 family metallopeptidase [Paracoccaceae bacterium]
MTGRSQATAGLRVTSLKALDPDVYAGRRRALMDGLQRPVMVFGMGSALGGGTKSHGALRYLTGWDGHESASLLVLSPQGARLIVNSPFMAPLAVDSVPELAPVYAPPANWMSLIRLQVPTGDIGLIGIDELPTGMAGQLALVLRDDVEAAGFLDSMRLIKEPSALQVHRQGAAICDTLFVALPKFLRSGTFALSAQRELEALALSQGADYCRTWLTVRPVADRPRYWPSETGDLVAEGDQVLFGIALTVDGHWAHGIRTGSVGPLRQDHAALLRIVSDCLEAGLALARPGVALADLADAMEAAFAAGTSGLDMRAAQRFRFGHGLGLSYEDPILTDAFVQGYGLAEFPARPAGKGCILASGMVLELHPNLFLPRLGGAALGEMVIVTDQGPERPIRYPLAPRVFGQD